MVDAAAWPARTTTIASEDAQSGLRPATEIQLVGLPEYSAFCASAAFAPAQSPAWLTAWAEETGADLVIALLSRGGTPVFALALEAVTSGPFKLARFAGGSHANGNFPALDPEWAARAGPRELQAIMRALRAARRDIDLVRLERMVPELDGIPNPLLLLPHSASPNPALAVSLGGGFDAVLQKASGKKAKKHRSQARKYEAAGGYRVMRAHDPESVDRLWSTFLAMKEHRFRSSGIANVFGEQRVQDFFRRLFVDALSAEKTRFTLEGLEVGGVLRAVTGHSWAADRVTCEFGGIVEDELAGTSPGDFLFFEHIRSATEAGLAFYDFGVGDEPYKRSWCDVETIHFDMVSALTARGWLQSQLLRGVNRGKAAVKRNPALWRMIKRLRRQVAGGAPPQVEDQA